MNEIGEWDAEDVEGEREAMLQQLAAMMAVNATTATTEADVVVPGMTHKRQATLKTLMNATSPAARSSTQQSMDFSVSDLMGSGNEFDAASGVDPEIMGYLRDLVGGGDEYDDDEDMMVGQPPQRAPLTPQASIIMRDLFTVECCVACTCVRVL